MKKIFSYFSKIEIILWAVSVFAVTCAFILFDHSNFLTLIASLVGVTSLIFNAKGNPFGQFLMIIFSLIYGFISYSFSYYGEMITYIGMTMPMACFSLVSWIRNPFDEGKSEVRVNHISRKEQCFMWILTLFITVIFYFILSYFNTANIIQSTLSVTTSFISVYLTFRRSPYFAIGYAANDIILIILWTLAAINSREYLSVVICFVAFLANDIYSFISWRNMDKRQSMVLKN